MNIGIKNEFEYLAREWYSGVSIHSGWHQMRKHPTAQRIVDLGESVVPCLIHKLKTDKWIGWSHLLKEITKFSPYQPVVENGFAKINVYEYANAWIEWGKDKYEDY